MKIKIYYYVIWALIVWIIGVLAFQKKLIQTQDTNIQVVVVDTWTSINTWIVDSWSLQTWIQENPLVYINTEYWFQLTLPEGWEGYRSFTYDMRENPWFWSGFIARIIIALPTNSLRHGVQDPNDPNYLIGEYTGSYQYITWYADMIGVAIRSPDSYEKYRCENNIEWWCINSDELLWKDEKYNYQLIWPQDIPTDLYSIWWNRNYFQQIISEFKVL